MEDTPEKYITSKEAMKELNISSCELMHLRIAGKLKYFKKGNSFMYKIGKDE